MNTASRVFQGWFALNSKATFQQYAIVPADIIAKVESNVDLPLRTLLIDFETGPR